MNLEIIEKHPAELSQKPPVLFVHGAWHGAWCWNEYFLPYFAVREALFSNDIDEGVLEKCFSQLQDESYFAFLDMVLLNLPRPEKIATPLLVLGAANDIVISPREVMLTAKAYNTQAGIIENAAHDMMLEKRWQDIADIIIRWLTGKNL